MSAEIARQTKVNQKLTTELEDWKQKAIKFEKECEEKDLIEKDRRNLRTSIADLENKISISGTEYQRLMAIKDDLEDQLARWKKRADVLTEENR